MPNICKNICESLKVKRNTKDGMYDKGYKFCSLCDVFFKTFEVFCLCCGTHLRTNKKSLSSIKTGGNK